MSKPSPTRTNEKLYFTRLHLDALQSQLTVGTALNTQVLAKAFCQSAAFHAVAAYRALIYEICCQQDMPVEPESITAVRAQACFSEAGKCSPELSELLQLEEAPGHWLNTLLQLYGEMFSVHEEPQPRQTLGAEISVQPVQSWDPEWFETMYRNLSELIVRFRAGVEEW